MKTIIKSGLLALSASALMLGGCSENSWNDNLDKYEVPELGTTTSVEYTLTTADYAAVVTLNKALAEANGDSEALAAVGKNCQFASEEQAHKYLPAFLASTNFKYYALNNGSSVKLTYNVNGALPEVVEGINAGTLAYTVSEKDYINAWGSDDNYINAFSPMTPPSAAIPGALKSEFPDAEAGTYAVATYNWSAINPVFGSTGSDEPTWKVTNVLGSVSLGQDLEVHGIVTAITTRGFIVTDNAGSILVYGAGFDQASAPLFSLVTVKGNVSSYGTAFQIALDSATIEVVGEGEYEYPDPKTLTADDVKAVCSRTEDAQPFFAAATVTCAISGNYVNLSLDGLDDYKLSGYYVPENLKELCVDGARLNVEGYVIGKSGTSFCNIVLTAVRPAAAKAPRHTVRRAPASVMVTEPAAALYRFNGTAWQAVNDVLMLQPSDYTFMGQSYANLSNNGPETLLPKYLALKYPFAAEEDVKTVCYNYFANSTNSYRAMQFTYTAGEWVRNVGSVTEQFSRLKGEWMYNPSIVLELPADKSAFCQEFYQKCVDYVFETQCVPLGDDNIKSGKFWVTSYGNNEYWSGTSAYQTNVDIRPAAARQQYAAGFEGMSDEEVQRFIVTNFLDHTLPHVLGLYYPDFAPIEGIDVTMTVRYVTYDGAKGNQEVVYKVVGPGKFERISSSIF